MQTREGKGGMKTQELLKLLIVIGATKEQVCAVLLAVASSSSTAPAGWVRVGTVDEYVERLMV
jgi:hypothetical protein